MVWPWLLWLLVFAYIPMMGIVIAFQNFQPSTGVFHSEWVGFENFWNFVNTPDFWGLIRNTLGINLLKLVFSFPIPIIFAILLYELPFRRMKRLAQTVSYLPHFLSWVIVTGIFSQFLEPEGPVNDLLLKLNIIDEGIMWRALEWFFWPLMVISGVWKELGWNAIIYIAAMAAISPELYEAAQVDGASRFQRIWKITLPMIMPTITVTLLFTLAGLFSAGFDQIYLFQNSTVLEVSEVLDTYIYKMGFSKGLYSFAAAGGLFQSVINLIIVVLANRAAKKINGNGLW